MTTQKLTRYRMEGRIVEAREINPLDSEVRFADVDPVEALNGEWVKWEDVKRLLQPEPPTPLCRYCGKPASIVCGVCDNDE